MASGSDTTADDDGVVVLVASASGGIFLGGAYGDITSKGIDAHHTPPRSSTGLPINDGPAIQMDPADHAQLPSTRGGPGSWKAAYREGLREMVLQGRFRDALAVEIKSVRSLFGSEYGDAIRQMMDYAKSKGLLDKK